jgi:hypothetical protein
MERVVWAVWRGRACRAAVLGLGLLLTVASVGAAEQETGEAPSAPPVVPATANPRGNAPRAAFAALAARAATDVSGEASLLQTGTTTIVVVALDGLAPDSTHAGHVHAGDCAGPSLYPLPAVRADANGAGSVTGSIPAPLDTGGWWLQYDAGEASPGRGMVCGPVRAAVSDADLPHAGDRCPARDGVAVQRC